MKEDILKKAMLLFLTKNYRAVTISEIQNAVGCSRGCLYHHFKSKEEIFEKAVEFYLLPAFSNFHLEDKDARITLFEAINASTRTRKQYISFLRNTLGEKISDLDFFKFVFQASEYYPGFLDMVNKLVTDEIEKWHKIIEHAIKTGELNSNIDVEFAAKYFVMLPFGVGLYKAFQEGINGDDINAHYVKFYNLIKK